MRISDWSSDVCSSDLHGVRHLMYPPVHLEAEPDDDRHSWLVFITSGLARHEITENLDRFLRHAPPAVVDLPGASVERPTQAAGPAASAPRTAPRGRDRKSVWEGKRESVCGGPGGR